MNDVLINSLKESENYQNLLSAINDKNKNRLEITGLSFEQKANMLYSLFTDYMRQTVYIANSEYEAKKIIDELNVYMKNKVEYLNPQLIYFYTLDARDRRIDAGKMKILMKLIKKEKFILVSSVEAILEKYIPKEEIESNIIKLKVGKTINLDEFKRKLINLGYQSVSKVEGFGQFSVRGGVIDIFTLFYTKPIRIEFFDDEIDSIREFDVFTQKSINKMKSVVITPSRKIIYPENIEDEIINITSEINENTDEDVLRNLEKIKNREYFDGVANYIDYLYKDTTNTIFDYLDEDAVVCVGDVTRFYEKCKNIENEFRENYILNLSRGLALKKQGELLFNYEDLEGLMKEKTVLFNSLLPKNIKGAEIDKVYNFNCREMHVFNGKLPLLVEEVRQLSHKGYKVILALATTDRAKKISNLLFENDIDNALLKKRDYNIENSQVVVLKAPISKGFQYEDIKMSVITDKEIIGVQRGNTKKKKKDDKKKAKKIDSFMDLKQGDYVVHENNGVGRYTGIEQISINAIKKDYLKIVYREGDNLYVPIEQMDKVQKYIGADVERVRLNKLGTSDWTKAKNKVKREIEDMTQELIELYAKRQSRKGFKFSKDTIWQKEFESKFPYEETQDQLKAIKDTKKDMEKSKVMDRLICGDVGYGKTEVAIRAIFKAFMDKKQVAVLVPTTILAQQHYSTFTKRFEEYGINVEVLSRFKNAKEQKEIIEGLRKGTVDVIIGTHRIISKDIAIPNLGLLIVDEEQRFGVKHKEKLKQIRTNVDVLTLSATPIPRTLHMSLSGIRDMSIIEEPPQERYPVRTYVTEGKNSIIQDEIEREMERGGQVFFLYNRVEGIERMAKKVKQLIPDCRVGVAHGRMSATELENTILSFLNKEYDVLVCTTIIETGMDIANANTIIIYDADRMGLAQLYQLRGRVGRSTRQGYAYLMYEKDKVLSEIAEKRLKAIKEFTEFGSGFKIAMRDLEIRGAGDVLGAQQHGHMATIGYELYVKMLNDAISKIKGEVVEEEVDVEIDLKISAYIPSKYIFDEVIKLEMYKKIATIQSKEDMYEVQEELEDRFSDIPKETQELLNIAYIKNLSKKLKIEKIKQTGREIDLIPITKYTTKGKNSKEILDELEDMLNLLLDVKNKKNKK